MMNSVVKVDPAGLRTERERTSFVHLSIIIIYTLHIHGRYTTII